MLQFDWDEKKNTLNIANHGIDFEKASAIFKGETVTTIDGRFDYGEVREVSMGLVDGVVLLVVVHTDREGTIWLISARKATKRERKLYEKTIRKSTHH